MDPLKLERTIPLSGVEGRIDHLAVDTVRRRLFVAALGNDTVEVVDLAAGRRIESLHGVAEPQGIAFDPKSGRVFVASGRTGECAVFDAATFKPLSRVALGEDADNVRLDAAAGTIYVGYGNEALAAIEAATGKRLFSVGLPGHPESFQLESAGPRIFVNVPDARKVAVIDRARRAIVTNWPVVGAQANFPMALDEAGKRLLIGCRSPARLLSLSVGAGAARGSVAICGDTDDLFYDAVRKRIYALCGAGSVDVLSETLEPLARVPTAAGARTGLFVPALSRLYVAVPHRGAQTTELRVFTTEGENHP